MRLFFDRIQDAPDAILYLNNVKMHLSADKPTLEAFLAETGTWLDVQNSIDDVASSVSLARIATVLKFYPKLLRGFNALLGPGRSIECSTLAENKEVKFFVLVKDNSARILPTSDRVVPFPSSDHHLRDIIQSKEAWKDLLELNSDTDWLICISQVLQVILDDVSTNTDCHRRTYRCLRELTSKSILPPSIFINNLTRGQDYPVQGGAFADIYKGNMRGTPVCFRVLRMFEAPSCDRETMYKDFCSEVLVWRQLKHVNILPFIGANLELFSPKFCFISPWLRNGDIMSYLKEHPNHDRFTSICEIVQGIEYLHNLEPPVTHKDIKGANVLVRDDLVCCLADFGLSSIIESQCLGRGSPAFEGSVPWAAPEIFDPTRYAVKDPTAVDIYALACTIYEIYTGKAPFLDTHKRVAAIIFSVMKGDRPYLPPPGKWTPEEETIWWLVGLCWQDRPQDRPQMTLIKNTLRDIGMHSSHSPATPSVEAEEESAEIDFYRIRLWLEQESSCAPGRSQQHSSGSAPRIIPPTQADISSHEPDLGNGTQTVRQTYSRLSTNLLKVGAQLVQPIFVPPASSYILNSLGPSRPKTSSLRLGHLESDSDSDACRVAQIYTRRRSKLQDSEMYAPVHDRFLLLSLSSSPPKEYAPFTPPSTPLLPLPQQNDFPKEKLAVSPPINLGFSQTTNPNYDTRGSPSHGQSTPTRRPLIARVPPFLPTLRQVTKVAHGPRPRDSTSSAFSTASPSSNLAPSPLGQSTADQSNVDRVSTSVRHASAASPLFNASTGIDVSFPPLTR